jgi:hypothetical protein
VPVVRLRADATCSPFANNTFNAGFAGAYGWMTRILLRDSGSRNWPKTLALRWCFAPCAVRLNRIHGHYARLPDPNGAWDNRKYLRARCDMAREPLAPVPSAVR